jgi:hypothetical protein
METNNRHKNPDDVIYHLELILKDLYRLKVDYNRDERIVHASDFISNKILLIVSLYLESGGKNYLALRNKLNTLFKEDPNIKGVIVQIENSKSNCPNGTIKHFKQII